MKVLVVLLALAAAAHSKPESRIINGQAVLPGQLPYVVSLQDSANQHFCGGSIISNNAVLTSAVCVNTADVNSGRILAGTVDLTVGGVEYKASEIIVHPQYGVNGGRPINDIAIIKTKQDFVFDANVGTVALPMDGAVLPDGTPTGLAGWGTTAPGGPISYQLMRAVVPIIDPAQCNVLYADLGGILPNQICAGGNGKDSCNGDSGGPLFFNETVWGMPSWGSSCADDVHPGVYTEVAKYRSWIDSILTP